MSKKTDQTDQNISVESVAANEIDPVNDFAMRIWHGQSVSLSLSERVERIKRGLLEQGFDDFSALSLPAEGFERFL